MVVVRGGGGRRLLFNGRREEEEEEEVKIGGRGKGQGPWVVAAGHPSLSAEQLDQPPGVKWSR